MTFEPGQTVDERFHVGRRLGGNVHGSTCKAKSLLSDREVVLKKLHHDPDQGMQQQLLQAQQAQQLSRDCDQLLMIDEVSVDGEDVFCVLPFLPARSLKRQKPPEAGKDTEADDDVYFAEDFEWLNRVAKALDYLADKDLRHGDVKPTNILFKEDKQGQLQAYLSDIEIPKPRGNKKAGQNKDEYPGTMAYLAREVFLDRENASSRSDQYSLAVTLYEWLAGELPFKGITGIEMYNAFKGGFKPITEFRPDLPQPAADALHRALAEEPEQRFESSGEFAAAFVESLPSRSGKTGPLSWQKLANGIMIGAAALLLLFAAGRFLRPAEQPADLGDQAQVADNRIPVAPSEATNKLETVKKQESPNQNVVAPANIHSQYTSENRLAAATNKECEATSNNLAISEKGGGAEEKVSPSRDGNNRGQQRTPQVSSKAGLGDQASSGNDRRLPQRSINPPGYRESEIDGVKPIDSRHQKSPNAKSADSAEVTQHQPLQSAAAKKTIEQQKLEVMFQQYFNAAKHDALDAKQLYALGQMFENGVGTTVNIKTAYSLYQKAATKGKGWPAAQLRLGEYYEENARSSAHLKEAYHWYEKAAKQLGPDTKRDLAQFCDDNNLAKWAVYWRESANMQEKVIRQQNRQAPKDHEPNVGYEKREK